MSTYFISMPEDLGKKYQQFNYPAGEVQVRLLENQLEEVKVAKKIVVTARITDGNPMPLALLTDALFTTCENRNSNSVLVLPYLPYGRADRRFVKGDCAGLSTFGHIINDLGYHEVYSFDVHSSVSRLVCHRLHNVNPMKIIESTLDNFTVKPTIILPDEGSGYRYDWSLLKHNLKIVNCSKHRDAATGKLTHFEVPEITTSAGLIVDDICDGGATFIGIAKKLKEQQPDVKLYLYVSHGIFSKGLDDLQRYFEHIYTTNSVYGGSSVDPLGIFITSLDPSSAFVTKIPIDGFLRGSFLDTKELFEQVEAK